MKLFQILIVSFLLVSCNNKQTNSYTNQNETNETTANTVHPGKKLMETHCYACHNPTTPENNRIAPPMVAIKAHYINNDTTKKDFIEQMVSFTNNPTEEEAKLFGAVRKFGVMPKQQYPEGVVEKIADYMYDYQIEEPDWFKDHFKREGKKNYTQKGKKAILQNTKKTPEDIGLEYALATKKVLGKNLMGTIQNKGTIEAVEFCNVKAIPLTDSMSVNFDAVIKRVSDKNRNPKNKANDEELKYIELYKSQVAQNIDVKPTTIQKEDKIKFYYPITTNTMCLQCHGKQNDIQPNVRKKILELYPNDLAYGYTENEVRGIWSIEFNKPNK